MGNALGSIWALYGFYMGSIKTHTILVAELSQRAFEALPGRARASGNGRGSRSRVRVAGEVGGSRVAGRWPVFLAAHRPWGSPDRNGALAAALAIGEPSFFLLAPSLAARGGAPCAVARGPWTCCQGA